MLNRDDIKTFTLDIKDGLFYWKVELADDNIYQIKYRIEQYITQKGNKSRKKVYFITKDEKELIFSDEVKKDFQSFRYPYIRCGI